MAMWTCMMASGESFHDLFERKGTDSHSNRLTLPFTISLNRLFDYRLDAVKLRVTRQSIWRRWFVRAFL